MEGQTESKPLVDLQAAIEKFGLSPIEVELYALSTIGMSQRHIAEQHNLSPKTVDKHIENARNKIGKTPGFTRPSTDTEDLQVLRRAGAINIPHNP